MELTVQLDFNDLLKAIRQLSPDQKETVKHALSAAEDSEPALDIKKSVRPLGTLKGLVAHMSSDFDAPLADFDSYQ